MERYSDSKGKHTNLFDAMGQSQCYIGLVSHSFATDLQNSKSQISKEVRTAKEFNLHFVLFLFDDLTPEDRKIVDKVFSERVLKKFECTREGFKGFLEKNWKEIMRLIETLEP